MCQLPLSFSEYLNLGAQRMGWTEKHDSWTRLKQHICLVVWYIHLYPITKVFNPKPKDVLLVWAVSRSCQQFLPLIHACHMTCTCKIHFGFIVIWGGSQTPLISPKSPIIKEYKSTSSSDFSPLFYIILEKSLFFSALIFQKKFFHFLFFLSSYFTVYMISDWTKHFSQWLDIHITSIITPLYSITTLNQQSKFTPKRKFSWFPYPPG